MGTRSTVPVLVGCLLMTQLSSAQQPPGPTRVVDAQTPTRPASTGAPATPSGASATAQRATANTSIAISDADRTRAEIQAVEKTLPQVSDRGAALFLLARRYAHLGELEKALDLLKECMALDQGFDPSDSPSLKPLRSDLTFRELVLRAQRQYPAVHRAKVAVDIPANDLFPEGLAVDAANGTFYMSSMHHKKIVVFTLPGPVRDFAKEAPSGPVRDFAKEAPAGQVRDFVKEGPYDLSPVGGVHVDPTDHSVWAATDAGIKERPELLHFDPGGRLLERYPSPGSPPYDLNDLVLHGPDEIFTTDTEGNHVYRFDRSRHTFSELHLFRPVFYPNGITVSGDGRLLFVADMLGVIRVDLGSGDSRDVDPGAHNTLSGIDGLYWYQGDFVGVQYGTGKYRVMRWGLSSDGRRVMRSEVLEYRTELVDDPTTGALYDGRFYFIANSGIDNLHEDEIVDPAKLAPVHIAYVPLR